ncbi:MAG: hypothetical protein IPH60_15280 [Flavobacteriales bacterium]|nr:hypothetical protein [Flavobacteriales bacterium]
MFKIAPQRIKVGRIMPGQGLPWEPSSWFVRGFAQWDAHRVLANFFQGGSALFDERDGTLVPAPLDARTFGTSGSHGVPLRDSEGRIWMQDGREIRCIDPRTSQLVYHFTAACGDRIGNCTAANFTDLHLPSTGTPAPRSRSGAFPHGTDERRIRRHQQELEHAFVACAGWSWSLLDVQRCHAATCFHGERYATTTIRQVDRSPAASAHDRSWTMMASTCGYAPTMGWCSSIAPRFG